MPTLNELNTGFYWILAGVAAYYFLAWLIVGSKRGDTSVVVRYQPPEGLSPAAIRYVYALQCDGRSYAAIVAHLAARKLLAILPDPVKGETWLVRLSDDYRALRSLPEEEKRVFNDLLEFDERVQLKTPDLRDIERIQSILDKEIRNKYFTRNFEWVLAGMALSGVGTLWLCLGSGIFGRNMSEILMPSSFTGFTVSIFCLWSYWMWDTNRLALKLAVHGLYRRRTVPILLTLALIYPTLWFIIMQSIAPVFTVVTTLLILLNAFAAPLLSNYTAEGRRVRNEIEGFRRFLEGTEQDRLQRMNPHGQPASVDTQFIPYAIALDLREGWGDELGISAMVETAL